MLRNMQELKSYAIGAVDGEVGKVSDIFFDEESWVVRYLVVDTGSWLTSRKVLISPYAVQRADWDDKRLPVSLTREQVKNCPDIDTSPQVRSCQSATGARTEASDGDIGHVHSMLIDEETWAIRYLVLDTSNWLKGHKVLVPPKWVNKVNWANSRISINLTRETIQNSPRYESSEDLNRSHELELYSHYGRPTYWEREHARETAPAELLDY